MPFLFPLQLEAAVAEGFVKVERELQQARNWDASKGILRQMTTLIGGGFSCGIGIFYHSLLPRAISSSPKAQS